MYALFIIHNNNLQDEINILNKVLSKNYDKFIIGKLNISEIDNLKYSNIKYIEIIDVPILLQSFYAYKLFKNYTYCIEININLMKHNQHINIPDNFNQIDYIAGNYKSVSINNIFNDYEIENIQKINKHIFFTKFNNKIINNMRIYNIVSLTCNTFYENLLYLYNKLLSFNLNITNNQLLVIYQLLYPNHFLFIEENLEENLEENFEENNNILLNKPINDDTLQSQKDIWYGIRSHFKLLCNQKVITIKDTYLRKNNINEIDKRLITIGKKYKLNSIQPYNYFYILDI